MHQKEEKAMILAISICEKNLCDIYEFETLDACGHFEDGFVAGAGNYGMGSCGVFILEEINDPDEWPYDEELAEEARQKLAAYIPKAKRIQS